MNGFSAALGSWRAAGQRAGKGSNRGGNRRANRPLHVRDLRLEQLEDRTLLSIGVTGPQPTPQIRVTASNPLPLHTPAPKLQPTTTANSVVAASLRGVQQTIQTRVSQGKAAFQNLSSDLVHVDAAGRVQVYVHVAQVTSAVIKSLASAGLAVDTSNADMRVVQGWVSSSSLDRLAAVAGVQSVAPPVYAYLNTGSVDTAGDGILNADDVRSQFAAYGINGSGIKVGVISDGVTHKANSQATGDLPASITVNPSLPGSGDEGTAMLEIVNDLAPGAQLYFSGAEASGSFTSADMVSDINWLAAQGCRVIVDDVSFFDQPFFQDGAIANTVAGLPSSVVYVTAAGNSASAYPWSGGHYQGMYAPYPSTNYQTFYTNGTTAGNVLPFPTSAGYVNGYLEWSDAWGASANNYDLYLFGWTGSAWTLVASSTGPQNGSQNPWEGISYSNSSYSEMGWVVNKASGSTRELELYF